MEPEEIGDLIEEAIQKKLQQKRVSEPVLEHLRKLRSLVESQGSDEEKLAYNACVMASHRQSANLKAALDTIPRHITDNLTIAMNQLAQAVREKEETQ